jgi:hypothetical protein
MAEHFRDRVLAELVTRGLTTDEVPAQILSQEPVPGSGSHSKRKTAPGSWRSCRVTSPNHMKL